MPEASYPPIPARLMHMCARTRCTRSVDLWKVRPPRMKPESSSSEESVCDPFITYQRISTAKGKTSWKGIDFTYDPNVAYLEAHRVNSDLDYGSPRIAELANPVHHDAPKPRPVPAKIKKSVLKYKATNRIKELAQPVKRSDTHCRPIPIAVSDKAQKYEPSDRIKNLARPKDKDLIRLETMRVLRTRAAKAKKAKEDATTDGSTVCAKCCKEMKEHSTSKGKKADGTAPRKKGKKKNLQLSASGPCSRCECLNRCKSTEFPLGKYKRYGTGPKKAKKKVKEAINPYKGLSRSEHVDRIAQPRKIEGYHTDLILPLPVKAAAMKYEATPHVTNLATPKRNWQPDEGPLSTLSDLLRVKYVLTKRTQELAQPKKQFGTCDGRSPFTKVTRTAMNYEPSQRIIDLAMPKFHKPCEDRGLPIKPPEGALIANATERIIQLALPKREYLGTGVYYGSAF